MSLDITLLQPFNLDTTKEYTFGNVVANIKTDSLMYSNGSPYVFSTSAGGSNTQIQFNDANNFAGSANFTFDKTSSTLTVTNISANGAGLTSLAGANVTGQVGNATVAGTVYTNSQPNITSVGTLTGLIVSGNTDLGNIGNIKITGGTANYILKTDGTGNLTWTEQANLSGYATESYVSNSIANLVNSAPAVLDTLGEISNALGNDANFTTTITNSLANKFNTSDFVSNANTAIDNRVTKTFVDALGVVANIANTATIANTANTVTNNAQPNITSVGTLTSLDVTGNITSGNANLGNAVTANFFVGNGSLLTGLPASYSNTDVANYLPTYTGNLSAGNANLGNLVTANFFSGNANSLFDIAGANVTGQVSNASVAGTVYTNAQPNITSVGTLTSLDVSGNVSFTGSNVSLGNVANLKIQGGTANYVLKTDGTGNLSWVPLPESANITVDNFTGNGAQTTFVLSTTPTNVESVFVNINGLTQLKEAYSISGANVVFNNAPPNTAKIEITSISLLTSVGSSSPAGLTWNIANSNITMSSNNGYFVDTSDGEKTMTLPASANLGDTIRINDLAGTFSSNACTIARNGHKIQGVADDLVSNTNQSSFGLVYSNSTYGWKILEVV